MAPALVSRRHVDLLRVSTMLCPACPRGCPSCR
ncbi:MULTISPECIES: putative leader peptide [Streptomyces]|uniref:Leader peptide n=1 Tax=Streptomyces flavovirens TaxID=52258 RepID=A0ABV8NE56_9ACTN